PRMLAVLQKVDALREAHFAKLRERGKQEADVKARAKAEQAKRKKPPVPKASRRARWATRNRDSSSSYATGRIDRTRFTTPRVWPAVPRRGLRRGRPAGCRRSSGARSSAR